MDSHHVPRRPCQCVNESTPRLPSCSNFNSSVCFITAGPITHYKAVRVGGIRESAGEADSLSLSLSADSLSLSLEREREPDTDTEGTPATPSASGSV